MKIINCLFAVGLSVLSATTFATDQSTEFYCRASFVEKSIDDFGSLQKQKASFQRSHLKQKTLRFTLSAKNISFAHQQGLSQALRLGESDLYKTPHFSKKGGQIDVKPAGHILLSGFHINKKNKKSFRIRKFRGVQCVHKI